MKLSDFDYDIPVELIAQVPLKERSSSRLMIVKDNIEHKNFSDIINYLEPGDVLVLNETKVEPCRLTGKKSTGAKTVFLIFNHIKDLDYEVQISSKKPRPGIIFEFEGGLTAEVISLSGLNFICRFNKDPKPLLEDIGEIPLPPYIKSQTKETKEQYQTVYAKNSGSIAAPTAGFHFTPTLLQQIEAKGIQIIKINLHVGYGTFLQVKQEDISKHHMHEEQYEISESAAKAINQRRGRLVIVGTTTLRAIESASNKLGIIHPKKSSTDIFIYPPYKFKSQVDILITNFHLPKSTLLMLVSAFASKATIDKAYQEAIKEKYRFYSFGDAMLLFACNAQSSDQ
ncbi:tRNA preQ1(34) S-adenosylmethionine ribosyltransferase-isomerase QueA [Nanoarchaeota archaeon]